MYKELLSDVLKGLFEVCIENFLRRVYRFTLVFKKGLPRIIVGSAWKGVYFVPSVVYRHASLRCVWIVLGGVSRLLLMWVGRATFDVYEGTLRYAGSAL